MLLLGVERFADNRTLYAIEKARVTQHYPPGPRGSPLPGSPHVPRVRTSGSCGQSSRLDTVTYVLSFGLG